MMESLSTPMRRFVAIALLFGALYCLLSLILFPSLDFMGDKLAERADARFERARLEAVLNGPQDTLPPAIETGLLVAATDDDIAAMALTEHVSRLILSSGQGLSNELVQPVKVGQQDIVAVDLVLAGPEVEIMRFISSAETGRPMLRFVNWKLAGDEGNTGQLRLTARVLAAWKVP
ncbi:MAG: hypothetical protein R3E02_04175 [Blastomonas sp.]